MKYSIYWAISALIAVVAGTSASAEYVSADILNCRSDPSATAEIVTKLNRGRAVDVQETTETRSLLSEPNCWVLSRYLSASYVSPSSRSTTSSRISGSSRSSQARQSQRASTQSGCPCSGNRVCIGPRGGRYCITSGGNKRYGV
jgi:uncharacterized protein YgiM (DUF1202 family)